MMLNSITNILLIDGFPSKREEKCDLGAFSSSCSSGWRGIGNLVTNRK